MRAKQRKRVWYEIWKLMGDANDSQWATWDYGDYDDGPWTLKEARAHKAQRYPDKEFAIVKVTVERVR